MSSVSLPGVFSDGFQVVNTLSGDPMNRVGKENRIHEYTVQANQGRYTLSRDTKSQWGCFYTPNEDNAQSELLGLLSPKYDLPDAMATFVRRMFDHARRLQARIQGGVVPPANAAPVSDAESKGNAWGGLPSETVSTSTDPSPEPPQG